MKKETDVCKKWCPCDFSEYFFVYIYTQYAHYTFYCLFKSKRTQILQLVFCFSCILKILFIWSEMCFTRITTYTLNLNSCSSGSLDIRNWHEEYINFFFIQYDFVLRRSCCADIRKIFRTFADPMNVLLRYTYM